MLVPVPILVLMLLASAGGAYPDEVYGTVARVVDGDTFDLSVEKADGRVSSSVERIRLADVDSPEMSTDEGIMAREFASAVLLNRRVYLDVDDARAGGRDNYGRLVCVVYLSGTYGGPVPSPCFNRLLVDSGHAGIDDFSNNEFSPGDWWDEDRSIALPLPAGNLTEGGKEVEDIGRGIIDWLSREFSDDVSLWLQSLLDELKARAAGQAQVAGQDGQDGQARPQAT